MVSTARIVTEGESEGTPQVKTVRDGPDPDDRGPVERRVPVEDSDDFIQGLSQTQIQVLAQKIYDLLLDELRIEAERYGRGGLR